MRAIIYRGMTKEDKWVEGSIVKWSDRYYISGSPTLCERSKEDTFHFGNFAEVRSNTIGQFSGFYDENSKKIFEDDIVLDASGAEYYVEWSENDGKFVMAGNGIIAENMEDYDLKVIGNIHSGRNI